MTHKEIKDCCELLKLTVRQVPSQGRRNYCANCGDMPLSVYWSTSYEGGLLGLPRVAGSNFESKAHFDTHARSIREIKYLVTSIATTLTMDAVKIHHHSKQRKVKL